MKLTHRYTSRDNWAYFTGIVLKIITVVVITLAMVIPILGIRSKREILICSITAFTFVTLTHLIPLIIIFLNHWKHSKNMEITLDTATMYYSITKTNGNKIKLHETEIISVTKVLSPPSFDDRIDWLFFGKYFYWEMETTSYGALKISCLTCDMDELFSPLKRRKKKNTFPTI